MKSLFDYKNVIKINTILVILLLASIASSLWTSYEVTKSNANRLASLALAQELKQSSADLTQNARLYVVTTDPSWEEKYNYIVDWTQGKKARPDGKTISMKELFKLQGFTELEVSKLKEASDSSGELINTEVQAMNAVKGLYKDDSGNYTKKAAPDLTLARDLMHNQSYINFLKKISKPIVEFNELLKTRLNAEVEKFNQRIVILQIFTISIALIIFSLSTYSSSILRQTLTRATFNLKNSSGKINDVMNNLQGASESLSSLSTEGAATVSETAAAVDETNSMIANNKELSSNTTKSTYKSKENATSGQLVVTKMETLMKEISVANEEVVKTVEQSNVRFGEIVTMINEISNKTKVINDIVFQTRLLSFNASVEAARAGDQGKGFAVVAEEVGNLAQMSGKSAAEITAILEMSIDKVQGIVNETRGAVEKIVGSARTKTNEGLKIAQECSLVLVKIVEEIDTVVEMSEKITIASTEQSNGMNEIAKAMGNIDQSTNETSVLSRNVGKISDELNEEIKSIALMINELEDLTTTNKRAA